MSKLILFVYVSVLFVFNSYSQQNLNEGNSQTQEDKNKVVKKCGTVEYITKKKLLQPEYESELKQVANFIKNWTKKNYDIDQKGIITIPVVVHIVWNTSKQNISDESVFAQIDALNRDYSGLNPHSMGAFEGLNLKSNTGIQFCLAKRMPDGITETNGIERRQTNVTGFTDNDNVKFFNKGGLSQWDPDKYFNIWVCNLTGGILGYADFPTQNLGSTYGVVIHYSNFGISSTGAEYPYDQGATTTHELGHCFSLFHIWGDDDGTCDYDDEVDDTPMQSQENYDCPATIGGVITDNCTKSSPGIMYMNFMDYSDDKCMANFTPGQKVRIQALFTAGGPLNKLKNSDACTPLSVGENEINNLAKISFYPNPASDFVFFDLKEFRNANIVILNSVGEIVYQSESSNICSEIKINVSTFKQGVYFVSFITVKGTTTKKLTIVRDK